MPSAQHVEANEQMGRLASTELRSLLRALHATNNGYLNSVHRRGKVLFAEGEQAQGLYIMLTGRAAVSISSSEGRMVILRTAQSGDVLGLNSVLNNSLHETTVKTLEPCCTDFVSRAQLLALMEKNPSY
jgi:CRP-like cAMP-binding protein